MFNIANAFRRSLIITDLRYGLILTSVENKCSEVQFVADVHKNICSAMST